MSQDNGTYILKTKDGYRIANVQAIDNIYWWWNDLKLHNDKLAEEMQKTKRDSNIFGVIGGQRGVFINPIEIYNYFHACATYPTLKSAIKRAYEIENEDILNYGMSSEYGINRINWNVNFPKTKNKAYNMAIEISKIKYIDSDSIFDKTANNS